MKAMQPRNRGGRRNSRKEDIVKSAIISVTITGIAQDTLATDRRPHETGLEA